MSLDKNNSEILTYQSASGDYSHATSKVSFDQGKKYYVDSIGISYKEYLHIMMLSILLLHIGIVIGKIKLVIK